MDDSEDDAVRLSSLDPGYLMQAAGDYAGFVGDQLEFTGFDLGSARRSGGQEYLDDAASIADYEDQWEVERQRYSNHLRAMRERDKALVKSANEKMRRAREKGKTRASLSQDEVEALERRRLQEKQDEARKDRRSSSGKNSRSSSAVNLSVDKTRRKSGSRFFSSPAANSSRTRAPKSPKQSRTTSLDNAPPSPHGGPGFVVPGPDGQPMYAPLAYYPPPSAYTRPSDARSTSTSSAYDGRYIPYSPRYFTPQEYRPSSSSRRSPPNDELHMPHASSSRTRASSSVDATYPYARPSSSGRRNVSGPADVNYARLRRMTPASPLQEYPPRHDSVDGRDRDGGGGADSSGSMESVVVVEQTPSASEESDSEDDAEDGEDEGVKVEVSLGAREGYRIERVPVGSRGKDRERDRDRDKDRDRDRDRRRRKR